MFTVKVKIYGVLYNQSSSIAFVKHLVIGQCQKAPNFSAFHWSAHGSLVSIGQLFCNLKGRTFTKKGQSKLTGNNRIGPKRT